LLKLDCRSTQPSEQQAFPAEQAALEPQPHWPLLQKPPGQAVPSAAVLQVPVFVSHVWHVGQVIGAQPPWPSGCWQAGHAWLHAPVLGSHSCPGGHFG
jgi:hypothetical protein